MLARIRRGTLALVCLTALAFASGGTPLASAMSPRAAEHITLYRSVPFGPPAGWTATGVVSDSGSWADVGSHGGGSDTSAAGTFQETTVQTSSVGTFTMRFEFVGTGSGGSIARWQIVGGTGAYAHLSGNGTWDLTFLPDGRLRIDCPGQVRLS